MWPKLHIRNTDTKTKTITNTLLQVNTAIISLKMQASVYGILTKYFDKSNWLNKLIIFFLKWEAYTTWQKISHTYKLFKFILFKIHNIFHTKKSKWKTIHFANTLPDHFHSTALRTVIKCTNYKIWCVHYTNCLLTLISAAAAAETTGQLA